MNKKIVPVILYALLFAYFYSFAQYGFNIWDEGGYANGTLRTYNGQTALKDFNPNGYLPGRYIYGNFFFKLFGPDIQSLRLGVALFTPGMVLMVYAAARRIMPPGFAFLAALGILSAPSMYYNRFYTFFCVLLLYLLSGFIEKKRTPWFFLLAGGILLCFFFKMEVALFSTAISAALLAVMFFQGGRNPPGKPEQKTGKFFQGRLLWVPALLIAGLGALSVYAIRNDLPGMIFEMVLKTHEVWGNPFPRIFPFFKLLQELGPHDMFERILFYLPLLVYLATIGVVAARLVGSGLDAINLHLLSIVSFGICAFGLVVWRAGFDNLLRTLPPFYILFCYLLFLVWKKLRGARWFPAEGKPAVALLKKTALNVAIVFFPFLFYYEMNTHHGFYAGSVGAVIHETAPLRLNRMEVYTHPVEAKWLKDVVSQIQTYSRKGDPIFALPLNPIFYYLTDRVNPTPYDWILPGMLDEAGQRNVVAQLEADPPKLIVFVDIPIDGREERRFSNYAPIIFEFIAANYRLQKRIGFFQILLPKSLGKNQQADLGGF